MNPPQLLPPGPGQPRRLSVMLAEIANDPARERIAIADVRNAMGDRAFGALLFVFAVPNTLPVNAPGVSVVLGIPLLFLSLQPHWPLLATGLAERLIGLVCAVLSIVLILPVPFGNMGPAVAICILAFALLEQDGKATLAGLATTIAALTLAWGVILAIVKAVSLLVRHWLGI